MQASPTLYEVIIEVNLNHPGGRTGARDAVLAMLGEIVGDVGASPLSRNRLDSTHPYVFATLSAVQIFQLVTRDGDEARSSGAAANPPEGGEPSTTGTHSLRTFRSIFRVWESQRIRPLITESIRTVKANAAHNSFSAFGDKVVWAVLDSGVDATHPHFLLHQTSRFRLRSAGVPPRLLRLLFPGTKTSLVMARTSRPSLRGSLTPRAPPRLRFKRLLTAETTATT